MAATAARAETSFLKLTRDRIPSVITVIKENIRQKTVRRRQKRCHGADGADIILKVPEGTVIMEAESRKVIADMSGDNRRQIVLLRWTRR